MDKEWQMWAKVWDKTHREWQDVLEVIGEMSDEDKSAIRKLLELVSGDANMVRNIEGIEGLSEGVEQGVKMRISALMDALNS